MSNVGAISVPAAVLIGHRHIRAVAGQQSAVALAGVLLLWLLDFIFFGAISMLAIFTGT